MNRTRSVQAEKSFGPAIDLACGHTIPLFSLCFRRMGVLGRFLLWGVTNGTPSQQTEKHQQYRFAHRTIRPLSALQQEVIARASRGESIAKPSRPRKHFVAVGYSSKLRIADHSRAQSGTFTISVLRLSLHESGPARTCNSSPDS